jgi:hypothetical protein
MTLRRMLVIVNLCSGIPTAVNSRSLKLAEVASTASREKLSSAAAVKSTDRSSGQ